MSNQHHHHPSQRRESWNRSSRRGSGQFREDPYNEIPPPSDDVFLMKVVAARMDESSENHHYDGRHEHYEHPRRDYASEQAAFMRSLQHSSHGVRPHRSSGSNDRQASRDIADPRPQGVANISFDDPVLQKVVLDREIQYLRSDDEQRVQIQEWQQAHSGYHCNHNEDPAYHDLSNPAEAHHPVVDPRYNVDEEKEGSRPSDQKGPPVTLTSHATTARQSTKDLIPSRSSNGLEPGAYAACPRDPSQIPGAYAEAPSADFRPSATTLDQEGEWESLEQGNHNPQTPPNDNTEPTAQVSLAEIATTTTEEAKDQSKLSTPCIGVILFGLIAGATAIAIGVLFAVNKKDAPQQSEPTPAPTLTKPEALQAFMASLPHETKTAIEEDPTSPQAQAYDWLTEDLNFVSYPLWRLKQRFALATIYHSLHGYRWESKDPKPQTWLHYDKSECDWWPHSHPDKACDGETGVYQGLELEHLSLTNDFGASANGVVNIPPELSLLTNLETLVLNDLILPINSTVSDLIPTSIHQLSQLTTISLVNLNLTGTLPSELYHLTSLQTLDLSGNQIGGSLPSQLGQLHQLETLGLEGNRLSGSLPSEVGLLSNLEFLYIQHNNISGPLPSEMANLQSIIYWEAQENALSGTVPTEIGLLTTLSILRWDDSQLTGPVPQELKALTGLKQFGVLGNDLTGRIPKELCSLRPVPRMFLNCSIIECCYTT